MSNSRVRKINYKPRYTQIEAYDLLPARLRDVMKYGPQKWCTVSVLNKYRKLRKVHGEVIAVDRLAKAIRGWHLEECLGHDASRTWFVIPVGTRKADYPKPPMMVAQGTMQDIDKVDIACGMVKVDIDLSGLRL